MDEPSPSTAQRQSLSNMRRGDVHTLSIDSSSYEGKSVARLDGIVVFVHNAVPGDRVKVRLTKIKKHFLEADVVDVLDPSPLRTDPPCSYFGTCGGCTWQHVSYEAQCEFKRQHVLDALERIGGFHGIEVQKTLGSPSSYFYRNKMEFSFGERWLTDDQQKEFQIESEGKEWKERPPALGLHIPGRYDRILDLHECLLQSKESTAIVNAVRRFREEQDLPIYSTRNHTGYLRNLVVRQSSFTNEIMVNLVTADDQPAVMRNFTSSLLRECPFISTVVNNITSRKSLVAIGDEEKVYHGNGVITEQLGRFRYRVSANSFFQTNTKQAERLYAAAKTLAELRPDDRVWDLYSGTGTIALFVADDVMEVVGIETVESAIMDARSNAEANNVRNCTFIQGDLKDKLTKDNDWLASHKKPTVIITDPPRSGMHAKVVEEIRTIAPERLVYVSCNPTTQARDLKLLCDGGLYRIDHVQPVDMFPHTYHIENVVGLAKSG